MDDEELDRLRRRFGEAKGGEIYDPDFAATAALVFRGADERQWPFAGVATFLGLPHRAEALQQQTVDIDVAVVGVPMDLGVTHRSGARFGPRAVRAVERIGPYEHALKVAPLRHLRAIDVGDVPMRSRFDLASCHADIEDWFGRLPSGVIPLSVGGDHSVTLPIMKALGRGRPLGMLHIDAHCDTGGEFEGSKFHHGGPFRQAVLAGVLDPRRCVQIGIRGGAEYLWEFSYESGMTVLHVEDVERLGVPAVIARSREVIGSGPVYVTFDVDGIDPGFAPGTGTPEAGGLTPREALAIVRGMAGLDIVGGDVVEVAPQYDPTSNTAQVAAQVLFELLCLVALRKREAGA